MGMPHLASHQMGYFLHFDLLSFLHIGRSILINNFIMDGIWMSGSSGMQYSTSLPELLLVAIFLATNNRET